MSLPTPVIETAPATRIAPRHADVLAKSGISVEEAQKRGIFSVLTPDGLDRTDLAHLGGGKLTGLAFPLRLASGATTWQLRLDDEHVTKERGKYAQAASRGAVFNVPEGRAHLVGKATKVLVVEGTKQSILADMHAAPDYLVIGIQGCRNWSSGGVPLSELGELIPADAEVAIAFDADWQTNLNVWSAARDLQAHLELAVGTKKPKLVVVPGGGKIGLDDSLGAIPVPEHRAAALQRYIDQAGTSLGRKPAKKAGGSKTKSGAPVIDWAKGLIYDVTIDADTGAATPVEPPLAGFAVRFAATAEIIDDRNPSPQGATQGVGHSLTFRTVSVAEDGEEISHERTLHGITDDQLRNIPSLLQLCGPAFTRTLRPTSPADIGRLEIALRTAPSDVEERILYLRTGWVEVDGEVGYLGGTGLMTGGGLVTHVAAQLDGAAAGISFPDPSAADERAAAEAAIGALDAFADATPWIAMEGHALWTLAGGQSHTLLAVEGAPGSGKTTIVGPHRARLGTRFATESLVSAISTKITLMEVGRGQHSMPLVIDDVLKRGSVESRAAHVDALDVWSRRANGAGGREKQKQNTGVGRSHVTETADRAEPGFMLVAEQLPDTTETQLSTLQRILGVTMTMDTLTDSEGIAAGQLRALGASGAMNVSTGGFLRWVASEIASRPEADSADPGLGGENAGRIGSWRAELAADAEEIATALRAAHGDDLPDPRSRELAAPVICGWSLWCSYLEAVGAITPERSAELSALGMRLVGEAMVAWTKRIRRGGVDLLAAIRTAVQSGRACLSSADRGQVIGSTPTIGGVDCVALVPALVAQLLGKPGEQLAEALAEHAIRGGDGKLTRPVRIGDGGQARAIVIPRTVWEGDEPSAEDKEDF